MTYKFTINNLQFTNKFEVSNYKSQNSKTNRKLETGDGEFGRGFTIVELMVSMGILTILFALTTINITRLPSSTSQTSSYDRLVSDLRSQQTKAMVGYNSATGATGGSAYGIYFYFDAAANSYHSYILFTGPNYSSGTDYYPVDLDPNLTFTGITFPDLQVVFATGSGDTASGSASITNSLTGEVKTLKLNKYGATE